MWDLPGPGIELVSPALAGGFLTTALPGKSLIIYLYQYTLLDIYFILWVIIQSILLLKLFQIWPLGALSVVSCVPLTCFLWFGIFFPAQSWNQLFLQGTHGTFCWRIVLETKIWVLSVLITTVMSLLLGPLSYQSKEMCVYLGISLFKQHVNGIFFFKKTQSEDSVFIGNLNLFTFIMNTDYIGSSGMPCLIIAIHGSICLLAWSFL